MIYGDCTELSFPKKRNYILSNFTCSIEYYLLQISLRIFIYFVFSNFPIMSQIL